jgi:hypothetical protein
MVMYEVVKELRETIRSLQAKITAQNTIISELKNVSGGGGGNGSGISFADIVKGKATKASADVVALLECEAKQHGVRC